MRSYFDILYNKKIENFVYKANKWKDIVSGLSGENYDNYKWSKDLINPFDRNHNFKTDGGL